MHRWGTSAEKRQRLQLLYRLMFQTVTSQELQVPLLRLSTVRMVVNLNDDILITNLASGLNSSLIKILLEFFMLNDRCN